MGGKHSPGYIAEYKRENYDRVAFLVPKGKKQVIKAYADQHGESMAKIIIAALEQCYGLNLTD